MKDTDNRRSFFVEEPIFHSKVYIFESGVRHKQTVVLVHGVSDNASRDWDNVVNTFDKSYHVVAFDLPGFGQSEKKDLVYSIEKYAAFLNWLINTYAKKPVCVAGHSLGGAISLYYAGTYSKNLDRLIVIDAPGILHRSAFFRSYVRFNSEGKISVLRTPINLLDYMVGSTMKSFDSLLMPDNFKKIMNTDIVRKETQNRDARVVAGISLLDTDFSEKIANVSVPTNIIWGEKDTIAPIRTGRLLLGSIPGSTLSIIPDGSHSPMYTNPNELNESLLNCLNGNVIQPKVDIQWNKIVEKQVVLNEKKDIILKGRYDKILIKNSEKIKLLNASANQVIVENSEVTIENSEINSSTSALKAIDSIITITGSNIKGENALIVSNCEFDIAGGKLMGSNSAILSLYDTRIVFSVCKVESLITNRYFHEILNVYENNPI